MPVNQRSFETNKDPNVEEGLGYVVVSNNDVPPLSLIDMSYISGVFKCPQLPEPEK